MSKTIDGLNVSDSIDQATFVAGSTIVHMQATPGGTEYNFNLPDTAGLAGDLLTSGGGGNNEMTWTSASFGTGTVTSVAATVPAFMTVSGTPITTTGTLAFGLSGTALPVVNGGTGVTTATGTGAGVHQNNATLTTPTINSSTLGGTTTVPGVLNVTNSTASTSTSTGAVIVSGGVGISGNTNIGGTISSGAITSTGLTTNGIISTTNATASTSTGTGAVTVVGGVGIGGNLNVGGTITGTVVPSSINTGGTITTTNTTDTSSVSTGSIVTAGGVGIAKSVNIGATLHVNRSGLAGTNQVNVSPATTNGHVGMVFWEGPGETGNTWEIGNLSGVGGRFNFYYNNPLNTSVFTIFGATGDFSTVSTTDSTSTTTGSFTTPGGIGVGKRGKFGDSLEINKSNIAAFNQVRIYPSSSNGRSDITFQTNTTAIAGAEIVMGHNVRSGPGFLDIESGILSATIFQLNSANGDLKIFGTTDSTSATTGSFTTTGGIGVAKNITSGARITAQTQFFTPPFFYASGTLVLTATSSQVIIYSGAGNAIRFPNATTLPLGFFFEIHNNGTGSITLTDTSSNFLQFINPGSKTQSTLIDQSTANGVWTTYYYAPKNTTWSSSDLVTPSAIQFTNGTNSTSTTTGAVRITGSGGLGVGGNIHAAGSIGALFLTTNDVDQFTYSTGTFAPTLAGDVTYVTQTGRFIQTGAEVKVAIYVQFNVVTSGTDLSITNLPFATAIDGIGFGIVGQGGMTGTSSVLAARGVGATTDLNFYSPLTETPIVLDNTWPTVTIQGLVTYFI